MAFKFSLESVLKVRKHQEKVQKQKLAEELMKKKKIDDVKVEVQNKLNHYLETDSVQTAENIQTIKRHGRHVLQTHELIRKLGSESQEVGKSVNEVRNTLADAHKECHILEKLKEVERQMFSKRIQRTEQKTMDEIATQSYSR